MVESYRHFYWSYDQTDWYVLLSSAKFVYNSSFSEDQGISSFELDLGWVLKSPLDFISVSEVHVGSVADFK